ncbi:hypothetical protein AOLI_G00168280 [Acnodon oligacanthus]
MFSCAGPSVQGHGYMGAKVMPCYPTCHPNSDLKINHINLTPKNWDRPDCLANEQSAASKKATAIQKSPGGPVHPTPNVSGEKTPLQPRSVQLCLEELRTTSILTALTRPKW